MIEDVNPTYGPESGGTRVTITGRHLGKNASDVLGVCKLPASLPPFPYHHPKTAFGQTYAGPTVWVRWSLRTGVVSGFGRRLGDHRWATSSYRRARVVAPLPAARNLPSSTPVHTDGSSSTPLATPARPLESSRSPCAPTAATATPTTTPSPLRNSRKPPLSGPPPASAPSPSRAVWRSSRRYARPQLSNSSAPSTKPRRPVKDFPPTQPTPPSPLSPVPLLPPLPYRAIIHSI